MTQYEMTKKGKGGYTVGAHYVVEVGGERVAEGKLDCHQTRYVTRFWFAWRDRLDLCCHFRSVCAIPTVHSESAKILITIFDSTSGPRRLTGGYVKFTFILQVKFFIHPHSFHQPLISSFKTVTERIQQLRTTPTHTSHASSRKACYGAHTTSVPSFQASRPVVFDPSCPPRLGL